MIAYLSLGSNQGDREEYLQKARQSLGRCSGIRVTGESPVLETQAMEIVDQPAFLNQVLQIDTVLCPEELLDRCQAIEKELGRIYRYAKGPREIDIDILLYGQQNISTDRLEIPHHSLRSRYFIALLLDQVKLYSF